MLYVGTAGFSYADWKGVFYPQEMKQQQYLEYYCRRFPCVELDYTYYRQPVAKNMKAMAEKVHSGFRFTVKAHKTLTHEIPPAHLLVEEMDTFKSGVEPLSEAGNLGCILFQFPWSYRYSRANLDYVLSLKTKMPLAPPVVEFRNREWARDDVFRGLKDEGIAFCVVDEPDLKTLFPRIMRVTSNPAYIRFHGRNAKQWFDHTHAWERYDYLYSEIELRSWLPNIRKMSEAAEDTYVLFNNCHAGKAATNALGMQNLLLEHPQ